MTENLADLSAKLDELLKLQKAQAEAGFTADPDAIFSATVSFLLNTLT